MIVTLFTFDDDMVMDDFEYGNPIDDTEFTLGLGLYERALAERLNGEVELV